MKRLGLIPLIASLTMPADAALYSVGLDKNQYTSDFMIGNVVVSVIFPESDGTVDPNSETWSADRKTQVLSEIMTGLNWWTQQNARSPLSFTIVSQTVPTRYEPITRPYYDEALWIPDIMNHLGYGTGSRFTSTRNYVNALRNQHGADWSYVIFVVDSQTDSNGKFADGYFAYAYLGGPFLVMTYDNNGYGISNMDAVLAHETGHIFHALDQYAGASSPSDYSFGYFPTINGNHAYSWTSTHPNSIMRGGIRWDLDPWAEKQIGWRDSNGNGRDDVFDAAPSGQLSASGSSGGAFSGEAAVNVWPRQDNGSGQGLTVDTISSVEYQVTGGDWVQAVPADGLFDSARESFQIPVSAGGGSASQSISAQDVLIRVVTNYASLTGGTLTAGVRNTLSNAHAYPNPFRPNSGIGHLNVTFTDLTAGAKVQIFTPAGEPVFDAVATGAQNEVTWTAIDTSGEKVGSGVYYYLISDSSGQKKKGKIAVIR